MDWSKLGNRKLTEEELWQKNLEVWSEDVADCVMSYRLSLSNHAVIKSIGNPTDTAISAWAIGVTRLDIARYMALCYLTRHSQ